MYQHYYYRSTHPDTVAVVQDYDRQLGALRLAAERLGEAMGGEVALSRSSRVAAHGVKFSSLKTIITKIRESLDVHWCRPDYLGYRTLRARPKIAKALGQEERAALKTEHERLQQEWRTFCPAPLCISGFWERLNVNTGNVLLSGGMFFQHQNTAYFHLGFAIDPGEHEEAIAAGKPSAGWIEGAEEIRASDYEAARAACHRKAENATAGAH